MRPLLTLLLLSTISACAPLGGEEVHLAGFWSGTLHDEVSDKVLWAELDLYPGGRVDYWLFYDGPGVLDSEEYSNGQFWFDGQTAELSLFPVIDFGVFSTRYLAIGEMDYSRWEISGELYDTTPDNRRGTFTLSAR